MALAPQPGGFFEYVVTIRSNFNGTAAERDARKATLRSICCLHLPVLDVAMNWPTDHPVELAPAMLPFRKAVSFYYESARAQCGDDLPASAGTYPAADRSWAAFQLAAQEARTSARLSLAGAPSAAGTDAEAQHHFVIVLYGPSTAAVATGR